MSQLESQMKLRDKEMVPRILVQAMFALMLASLALVSFAVLTERPLTGVPAKQPVVAEVAVTLEGDREGQTERDRVAKESVFHGYLLEVCLNREERTLTGQSRKVTGRDRLARAVRSPRHSRS